MTPYFDALAERLRASGLSDQQIAGTIGDLMTYVAESGTDPEDEFGAAADFADRLSAPSGDAGMPAPEVDAAVETWRWRADAFHERKRLNEFGDQGWEVERVDSVGRFVSHRDPTRPQRWEYRREVVALGSAAAVAERLAPDGWEPCGTWTIFEYFKRPKSAILGPAGELDQAPDSPERRTFFSRRFYVFIAGLIAALAVVLSAAVLLDGLTGDDDSIGSIASIAGFLVGLLVGGTVIAVWVVVGRRRARNRRP